MKFCLDKRLEAAASFVRTGKIVADIGTDHAYLPIYLVTSGISSRAIASDVNEGPIAKARENIALANVEDKVVALCTDGLCGIDEFYPDDIVICGMGGELIASILERSEYIKRKGIRLILQPMTSAAELFVWLEGSGFSVVGEKYAKESSRCYRIICAEYTGEKKPSSLVRAYFGEDDGSEEYRAYRDIRLAMLERRIAGIKVSGRSAEALEQLYGEEG